MKGKTIFEALHADEAKTIADNINKVKTAGETISYRLEMVSPAGKLSVEEHTIAPIRIKAGKITTFMLVGYDLTSIVQAQKLTEKINAYQEYESGDLSNKLMAGLSKGVLNLDFELEPHDEDTAAAAATYGLIADTVKRSLGFIKSYVDEITEMLKQIADKDFDVEINREYIGDFGSIKESIITMTNSVSALILTMQDTANGIDIGSERIASSMQELMASFESQRLTIDGMKGAILNMNTKTQKNVKNTGNAKTLSDKMKLVAQTGSEHMQNLYTTMEEIKEVSDKTAKIAKVVEDIAFKTNLLALNAAVEASRAGDHGRGFRVVAEEVRSLANRSAQAAKETSLLLEESGNRISIGEVMTEKTSEAFGNIVGITADVAELISEIAVASDEQAKDIDKIKNDMEEIFQMIAEDTENVQTNASETEELSARASLLNDLLKQFNTKKPNNTALQSNLH